MKLNQTIRDTFRLTGLFGVLAITGLLATACGTSTTTTAAKQPQLRVWRVGQTIDAIANIRDDFLDVNKASNIAFNYTNKSYDGYELAALKSLSARTGPDIWSIPNDWLGDHKARLNYLSDTFFETQSAKLPGGPLSSANYAKVIYPAGIADAITLDGHIYGLPTSVDTLHLYVNKSLLNAASNEFRASLGDNPSDAVLQPVQELLNHAPTTWSELIDQTKYITKRSGTTITRSAIAMGTADNAASSADLLQLLIMQNGADIVSSDHVRALFHIPITTAAGVSVRPGENALDFLTSFSNPNKPNYTWNPSLPQALDAFGQGKVAMVISYSGFRDQLAVKYPKLEYVQAPVPQISNSPLQTPVNLIKFWTETIPRVADNASIAAAFARNLAANATGIAHSVGLSSPILASLNEEPNTFPNRQVLTGRTVFKKSRDLFDADFRQMIIDVSQNGLTPSQALDSGAEKINDLLAKTDD
jgi:ABC-type glycerol-3-phosphate transport system substrate-binding protein